MAGAWAPSFAPFKEEQHFFFSCELHVLLNIMGRNKQNSPALGHRLYCTAVSVQLGRTRQSHPHPMLPWEPVVTSFSHFNPKAHSHLATKSDVSPA